jgi:hypothetical protein
MKSAGIIVIIWLISACASTKVHLYTRYLSDNETEVVTKKLQGLGFGVISNNLVFPKNIEQSTLVYSPFVEGEDTINRLITSMAEQGWPIPSVQPIFAGNHYYTKNSLGLLLLPQGAKRHDQVHPQDMVNEYQSKDCNISLKLTLHNDASYQFSYQTSKRAKKQSNKQSNKRVNKSKCRDVGKSPVTPTLSSFRQQISAAFIMKYKAQQKRIGSVK